MKPSAYEIARFGGRHAGFLTRSASLSDGEIKRALRSLQTQVDIHRDKIANPARWVDPGLPERQLNALVHQYWPKEIANFLQQIEILTGILLERKP